MEVPVRMWTAVPPAPRRLAAVLEHESAWLGAVALYAAVVVYGLPRLLAPDSWLAFVAGRELVDGLPRHDELTTWAAGATWIDQQWLGHLVLYAVYQGGGVVGSLLTNAAVVVATLAFAAWCARRRGGEAANVAAVLLAVMLVVAPTTALRTETLAYPLFIAVLWLLAADSRHPSRRVLLVLPILVVWGNLHGSALLGAGLAVVAAALSAARSRGAPLRPAVALLLAPLTLLASPYGVDVVDYFRSTVGNPLFPKLLQEWQPTSLPADWRVFALAALAGSLVARSRDLTPFERVTFVLLVVGALVARRYVVWLGLYVAVFAPALLERELRRPVIPPRMARALPVAGIVAIAVALAAAAARPSYELRAAYPEPVERVVARELARDRSLAVLASEMYADWLLYSVPSARGRIAFDTRFEILPERRLRELIAFNNRIEGWRTVSKGHRLLVLETVRHSHIVDALAAERRTMILYQDTVATVLLRGALRP